MSLAEPSPAAVGVELDRRFAAHTDRAWALYRTALTIRRVEEALLRLHGEGSVSGTVHTGIGQEACAVGVVSALDRTRDVIWSNHRGHGHYLAYCDDVEGLLAEVLGRETGVCQGIGGSQHLHRANFYSNGILGGTAPCAVGSALAEKRLGDGAIVCLFLGDGALAEGAVHESLNIAALWELPLLVCVEANGYAQSTPTALEHAGDIGRRAESFGIAASRLLADDIRTVEAHAREVVAKVRSGEGPHFLVLDTYRLAPHSKGDDLRPREEIEAHRRADPLGALGRELADAEPGRRAALEREVADRVASAIAGAKAAPALSAQAFLERAAQW
jgi:acetoin:2,6-dichlorophenolindophenol oxidoreductase subunit alpha